MSNQFKYSDDNKRYHTFNYHLKHKFNQKIFKVSLNAGFTCPNIDGSRGVGGCSYCSSKGSGDFAGNPKVSLKEQFESVKSSLHKKWESAKYIPYFQAHTNTYAPLDVLKTCFDEVLTYEDVVGLAIATRADCITTEIADYLAQLHEKTYLIVELGLQSTYDEIGEKINRCHTYAEFLEGYHLLKSRGINICVHLINGLPGESAHMMLRNVQRVNELAPHSVKLHLLHVLKGTTIASEYENGEFELLERDEYVNIVCNQLECLNEDIIIQRITGDGEKESLVGPMWSLKKFVVMNEIDKEMLRRNSYQGIKVK